MDCWIFVTGFVTPYTRKDIASPPNAYSTQVHLQGGRAWYWYSGPSSVGAANIQTPWLAYLTNTVLRDSRGSGRAPLHFTYICSYRDRVGVPRSGFEQPCSNHGLYEIVKITAFNTMSRRRFRALKTTSINLVMVIYSSGSLFAFVYCLEGNVWLWNPHRAIVEGDIDLSIVAYSMHFWKTV